MSINFRVPTLEACNRNVSRMESEIARLKASDASLTLTLTLALTLTLTLTLTLSHTPISR